MWLRQAERHDYLQSRLKILVTLKVPPGSSTLVTLETTRAYIHLYSKTSQSTLHLLTEAHKKGFSSYLGIPGRWYPIMPMVLTAMPLSGAQRFCNCSTGPSSATSIKWLALTPFVYHNTGECGLGKQKDMITCRAALRSLWPWKYLEVPGPWLHWRPLEPIFKSFHKHIASSQQVPKIYRLLQTTETHKKALALKSHYAIGGHCNVS